MAEGEGSVAWGREVAPLNCGNCQRGPRDEGCLLAALLGAGIRMLLFLTGTQVAYHIHYIPRCDITPENFADRIEGVINITKV